MDTVGGRDAAPCCTAVTANSGPRSTGTPRPIAPLSSMFCGAGWGSPPYVSSHCIDHLKLRLTQRLCPFYTILYHSHMTMGFGFLQIQDAETQKDSHRAKHVLCPAHCQGAEANHKPPACGSSARILPLRIPTPSPDSDREDSQRIPKATRFSMCSRNLT